MSKAQPVSKPFAGFEDHDACVRDNQDKEDPDAFCQWLEGQAKDALSDPNADKVLTRLTTEFVSSVDEPAQNSEWLIFKDASTDRRQAAEVERPYVFADPQDVASKAADVDVRRENDDGERQIAYAAVLIPNDVDKQGDVIPPYVVERAAHEYMAEYRLMDSDHDLDDGAGVPVESWILKAEQEFDTPDGDTVTYPKGTWIIGKRFVDDEWGRVKDGELTGFSIYGGAQAVDVDELMAEVESVNRRAKGQASGRRDTAQDMQEALTAASDSDTPAATLADRVQAAKGELPDEDAERVVELLRDAADVVDQATGGEPEADDEDGDVPDNDDPEDDEQESSKNDADTTDMTDDDTPDDGDTNDGTNDGADGDAVADGIDELKSMVKGVDEKVDDFDDRLDEVEDEVDALKSAVNDDPDSDRMNSGDVDDDVPENERMKAVAKQAATEAVAEVAGVDDADDPEVVRKGLREQVGADDADDGIDADLPDEDYSGVVDDADDTGSTVQKGKTGDHGNMRFAGGDA